MKSIFKKLSTAALAIIISACGAMTYADAGFNPVPRLVGKNRYETALKVDRDCFGKNGNRSSIAVISDGRSFKESLYGSHLASSVGAHFYPTVKGYISKAILNEIKANNVKHVYVMGTYKQLSKSIDNTLRSEGIHVERLFDGQYSYGMKRSLGDIVSNLVYMNVTEGGAYGDINSAIIINDNKFPDVITAVPFASRLAKYSLHLGSADHFEKIGYNDGGPISGAHFIIGGFSSVPRKFSTYPGDSEVGLNYAQPRDYTGRLAGRDRYETAVKIAEAYPYVFERNNNAVVIVNGEDYADALASSLEAVFNKCPILLTEPGHLNRYTKNYIEKNNVKIAIIVGGEKSVSKNVENQLREITMANWIENSEN